LERQDLSRMYLAHHELESDVVVVVIIIIIIIIIISIIIIIIISDAGPISTSLFVFGATAETQLRNSTLHFFSYTQGVVSEA